MKNTARLNLLLAAALLLLSSDANLQERQNNMTFFITSTGPGKGADLGGLDGADRQCQLLAQAVGAGNRSWRAYLSTSAADGKPAVNARDRIGSGPWQNAKGVVIASDINELHGTNKINKEKPSTPVATNRICTTFSQARSRTDALSPASRI